MRGLACRGGLPRGGLEFLDEAGFADAALAFQQDGSSGGGGCGTPGGHEPGQLLFAADEPGRTAGDVPGGLGWARRPG